ncbi:MAG: hypothetical protein ACI9FR_001217 [Cryomorphaceae bacterium]|jgi:hypothetical protein
MKKLILHIGYGKTGSSALQTWFALNAQQLNKQGVNYAGINDEAKAFQVNSGNGGLLLSFLNGEDVSNERLMEYYFGNLDCALISSEALQSLGTDRAVNRDDLTRLLNFAQKNRLDLRVIAFIRNIYNHNYSNYVQAVKRKGWCMTFEDWTDEKLNIYPIQFFMALRKSVPVSLLNYDSNINNLAPSFCRVANIEYSNLLEMRRKKVNRSLTHTELKTLQLYIESASEVGVDRIFIARKVSDHLVNNFPNVGYKTYYSKEVVQKIEKNFGSQISEFNKLSLEKFNFTISILNDNKEEYLVGNDTDTEMSASRARVIESLIASVEEIGTFTLIKIFLKSAEHTSLRASIKLCCSLIIKRLAVQFVSVANQTSTFLFSFYSGGMCVLRRIRTKILKLTR